MIYGDYHTHTCFSDGKSSIAENVNYAKQRGLKEVCISDHGYNSVLLGMTDKKWAKQEEKIKKIEGIKVLHGIESNILANGHIDVDGKDLSKIDVLIVGFHRLLSIKTLLKNGKFAFINGYSSKKRREKEIENNTKIYTYAINNYPIDILAHINNRTLVDVKKICDECAKNNVYVEINAKHLDSLKDCVNDMISSSCNFILSTDAHKAIEVGNMDLILNFIEENKVPKDRVYGLDKAPIFKKR